MKLIQCQKSIYIMDSADLKNMLVFMFMKMAETKMDSFQKLDSLQIMTFKYTVLRNSQKLYFFESSVSNFRKLGFRLFH